MGRSQGLGVLPAQDWQWVQLKGEWVRGTWGGWEEYLRAGGAQPRSRFGRPSRYKGKLGLGQAGLVKLVTS